MTYLILYKVGSSEETKLAQINADNIVMATEKTLRIFEDLELNGNRKHTFIDIKKLSEIRKLDALD